jgi:hypothetical protein
MPFTRFRTLLTFATTLLVGLSLPSLLLAQERPADPTAQQNAEAKTLAEKLTEATVAFLRGGSTTTPGVTVDVREYRRVNESGTLAVQYHAVVHGAPEGHTYTVFAWPVTAKSPSATMGGVTIGHDGTVMCTGRPGECGSPDKPNDPIEFTYLPSKGEPYRMMLLSEDQKVSVIFGVVPDPLVKTNQGCSVEAVRLMPKWEIVLIRATGLKASAPVRISMKSENEAQQWEATTNAKGEYFTSVLPFVRGKNSGKAEIHLAVGDCAPNLSFEWGKQ